MTPFDPLVASTTEQDVRFTLNGVEYAIVRSEILDRMKDLLEADHDDLRRMLARSAEADGWDEPGMEAYDSYPAQP